MILSELVHTYFDDVWERDNGEVYVDCCYCDDSKHRLGINVETGVAHCFKCEFSSGDRRSTVNGKRVTFNKLCTELGLGEVFSVDEGEEDVSVETKEKELQAKKPKQEVKLPKAYEPLWRDVTDSLGKKALKYLLHRGVTKEQIREFNIGFCGAGEYSFRIVFPVFYRGALKGLVCRDFSGISELKYLNSRGDKGLYNLPAKVDRRRKAILVEGVFDVLACDRAITNYDIIGGLGSKLTNKQLKQLASYSKIVIWAEPDSAGVEGTIKRAQSLIKKKVDIWVVVPLADVETDTDPGDMKPDEIKERIKEAKQYSSGVAALMRTRIAFSSKLQPKKKKAWVRKDR